MNLVGIFGYALNGLIHRKLRSMLTIMGIIIGVAVIVAILAVADGVTIMVSSELESMGSDVIYVFPSGMMASSMSHGGAPVSSILTYNDLNAIKKVPGLELVSPIIMVPGVNFEYRGEILSGPISGVEAEILSDAFPQLELESGRFIDDNDHGKAVIGYGVANNLFDQKLSIGSQLTIAGKNYRVVGIMEEIGGLGSADDNNIYVSLNDAKDLGKKILDDKEVSIIFVKMGDGEDLDRIVDDINFELRAHRKVKEDEEDFTVMSYEFVKEQVDAVLGAVTLAIFFVSAISLVVGAVGVSNTMFMSVLERTKEIGVLKSIGAKKNDILMVFLIESAMIGFIGGVIGLVLGYIGSLVVGLYGLPAIVTPLVAVGSILFAMFVSLVSGIIPANDAANKDIIESLRS